MPPRGAASKATARGHTLKIDGGSDQLSQYGTKAMPATVRDAPDVLDELCNNATELPIVVDYEPSGYWIAREFAAQLEACGINEVTLHTLIWPARLLLPRHTYASKAMLGGNMVQRI